MVPPEVGLLRAVVAVGAVLVLGHPVPARGLAERMPVVLKSRRRPGLGQPRGRAISNGAMERSQLCVIFQAKQNAFFQLVLQEGHFFHSLCYVLVAAVPPGTSSKNLELS